MEVTKLGRYEITGTLGQGAMGVVYKARDPLLDRDVAIKTVNMALEQEEIAEYGARFEQEARAAGGLNHPNVITIYDVGSSGNIAYMAMEFLDGRELRHLVSEGRPLPVAQALDVAAQVADGLAYAHERHVVHRDIKPANIMIVRGGRAKITDFGIARMRSSQVKTQTGMVLGSPKYMSPEQVMGQRADGRSDIFSLGVVLYEMLTGSAPFKGDSITALMFQVLNAVPTPPRQITPETPEMLNFVIAKALAKRPDERYQSALEFANDLRECAKFLGTAQPESTAAPEILADTVLASALDGGNTEVVNLLKTVQRTRFDDTGQPAAEPPPTLAVSKTFDSYEATMRVAAKTGMSAELDAYAKTQKLVRAIVPAAGHDERVAERSGTYRAAPVATRAATLMQKVKQHEDWAWAAGIVIALVAAAAIVYF